MPARTSIRGFSLIELLVALSVLAIVAAIIVPQFLGIREQAQQAVIDHNNAEIAHAMQMWQSLGGVRATAPDQWEKIHFLQFLATPGDGIHLQRGFENSDGSNNPYYPTDSSASYTVSVNAQVAGVNIPGTQYYTVPSAATGDGYYAKPNTTGVRASPAGVQGQYIYAKAGNSIYPVDSDLLTAIFIRTGQTPGDPAVTVGQVQ